MLNDWNEIYLTHHNLTLIIHTRQPAILTLEHYEPANTHQQLLINKTTIDLNTPHGLTQLEQQITKILGPP